MASRELLPGDDWKVLQRALSEDSLFIVQRLAAALALRSPAWVVTDGEWVRLLEGEAAVRLACEVLATEAAVITH